MVDMCSSIFGINRREHYDLVLGHDWQSYLEELCAAVNMHVPLGLVSLYSFLCNQMIDTSYLFIEGIWAHGKTCHVGWTKCSYPCPSWAYH